MSKRDYYEVLGVPRDADENAIKGAYRRLARQYHPDVNKAADAEERFKEINEAYEVLSDADRRAAYDRYGHAATQGFPGGGAGGFGGSGFPDLNDIFGEFFGGFGGMRGARPAGARPAGPTSATTWKSAFRKLCSARRRKLKFRGRNLALSVMARAPNRARSPSAVRSAMARVRCAGRSRLSWASSSA